MCAYGDFSFVHLIFDYHGPRATSDEFIPYDGSLQKLDPPRETADLQAFRAAMILNGVDLPGRGMFLTCEHTEADVEATVAAVAASLKMLA
jgi:hypothetical protein